VTNRTTYWIDTDPGVDDAVAILLALHEVGDRIVGLSSVHGNVSESHTATNLRRILGAAKSEGIVPSAWSPTIARGSRDALVSAALRTDDYQGNSYHGRDGLGDVAWSAPDDLAVDSRFAAQAIVDAARQIPNLQLVSFGPLTNVALALRIAPELPSLVRGILIMGGSLRAGGNESIAAEFNFAADPEAAHIVFGAGFETLSLVPIDPCDDVRLLPEDKRRIELSDSPIARLISSLIAQWDDQFLAPSGSGFYDPAAWLLGAYPYLAEWESLYVGIDIGKGLARGASIGDWRRRTRLPPNARVALKVPNRNAFYEQFFRVIERSP
jgi:purine nucleosidase